MWTDYYLKFEDRAEFEATMPPALLDAASEMHAMDDIGTLYRNDTHEAVTGYHVNLRLRPNVALPVKLAAFMLDAPAHPKRVFA